MVGVPGRSKGCNTCRKRRVKCDEGRPCCQRCTKAGFECLGYERERIWRNISTLTVINPAPSLPKTETRFVIRKHPGQIADLRDSPSPPPELSFVAFQDNFCFAFMFANHVWRSSGHGWLDSAASGKLGSLSVKATSALSKANFGFYHNQPDIERQGTTLYGSCLRGLAESLDRNDHNPGLIVPIMVLIMYGGWKADAAAVQFHLMGIAKLMHLCGPEAFQEDLLLVAFETMRTVMVVGALIGSRRMFLEHDRWRTVPWFQNRTLKTPQSEILDILVLVPGMLEDHATLESSVPGNELAYQGLLDRVQLQLTLLYRWRWRWQASSAHQISSDTDFATLTDAGKERPIPLRFQSLVGASELMLYNATLMWLLALLFKMAPLDSDRIIQACAFIANNDMKTTDFQPLQAPGEATTLHDPATEILRAFEWIAHHHMHDHSTEPLYLYNIAVDMAMTTLQNDQEKMAWAESLLHASATVNHALGARQVGVDHHFSRETFGMLRL